MKWIEKGVWFLAGMIVTAFLGCLCLGHIDFKVNIVDLLTLAITATISISVIYLSKMLDKKDVVRNIIVKEVDCLYDHYAKITDYLESVNGDNIKEVRQAIMMQFFKSDLIIDRINIELKSYFPKYYKSNRLKLNDITTPYYKWLTGGTLMENDFQLTSEFTRIHATELNKVLSSLKLLIHEIIRSI